MPIVCAVFFLKSPPHFGSSNIRSNRGAFQKKGQSHGMNQKVKKLCKWLGLFNRLRVDLTRGPFVRSDMVPLRFTDRKSGKASLLCLRSDRRKVYLDNGTARRLNSTKNKEYVSFSMFAEKAALAFFSGTFIMSPL
jgi:hypothetical protein